MKTRHKAWLLVIVIVIFLLLSILQAHTPTGRAISAQAHGSLIDSNPLRAPENPSLPTDHSAPSPS